MNFICEIVPSILLTPLRRALAQELYKLGKTQTEISKVLNVSQPVISTYLKPTSESRSSLTNKPVFGELVVHLKNQIIEHNASSITLMKDICSVCQELRTAGPLCEVHRHESNIEFHVDCSICFPSESTRRVFDGKLDITRELYTSALKLINTKERFAQLIPEIGCQFVNIVEGSQDIANIAGFPGRIVKVRNEGKIVSYPEFGHGSTLAQILEYFRKQSSSYHSLISIRKTDQILEKISQKKEVLMTSEADKNWLQTLQAFSSSEIQQIEIIADAGGYGLEPLIYIFGKNAFDIVNFLTTNF